MSDARAVRVSPDEARRLLAAGPVTILDVRTPQEFTRLGHLAGARLLPVDLIASALATLPDDGASVLVCCEHGVRSAWAAEVLVTAGVAPVFDLAGGMAAWTGPRDHAPQPIHGPAGWLLENADMLRPGMRVADVAAGRGRHALLLAAAGFQVTAFDRDAASMARVQDQATRCGWSLTTVVRDLEVEGADLGDAVFDAIVVTHYLHRPLMPAIVRALAPGGVLVYETFTRAQALRGKPTNPAFLLEPDELPRLVAPLEVLRSREGEVDGRMVASVVARKASAPEPA
ncbi:MAG: rhodanese-like domain-containing protein [Vicinamibacterales bacterium]